MRPYRNFFYIKSFTSACVGALLSLCLFAGIVQVTDTNDYRLLHIDPISRLPVYTKNSSFFTVGGCYENTVVINTIGFHGLDVPPQKGDDVFRIVIIGSSYVEARQVSVEDMYSTLLQEALNTNPHRTHTYEVIPLGVNANSPFLNALYYVWYGSRLQPDLVINFETQYELSQDYAMPDIDAQGNAVLLVPPALDNHNKTGFRDELRRFKVLVNLYNRYTIVRGEVGTFLAHPFFFSREGVAVSNTTEQPQQYAARWHTEAAVLGALAARVHSDEAQVMFASWYAPGKWAITAEELSNHFQDIALRNNAAYVDLSPGIAAEESAAGDPATWYPCDGHWTPAGNHYVASALYQYLIVHPSLLSRP